MTVIAITGGIGTGKTTVASLFKEFGADVFSADTIAKKIVQKGMPALLKIQQRFGKNILLKDGELNRKKLREIIFNSDIEKKWLENLLHPLVRDELKKLCLNAKTKIRVVEIPLLAGSKGDYSYIDKIIVCRANLPLRIERIMQRDSVTKYQATAIINSQPDENELNQIATNFIDTDTNLEAIKKSIEQFIGY